MKILPMLIFLFLPWNTIGQDTQEVYTQALELCENRDFKKANKQIRKANKKDLWTQEPELLYMEGVTHYLSKRVNHKKQAKSIELFSRYINHVPADPKGYFRRGLTFLGMYQFDLALKDFDKCLEVNPGFLMAYYYRGFVHQMQSESKLENAITDYSNFIALSDTTDILHGNARFHRDLCTQELNWARKLDDKKFYLERLPIPTFVLFSNVMDIDTLPPENKSPCLMLIPLRKEEKYQVDTMLLSEFFNYKTLSSLINLKDIASFEITCIRGKEPLGLGSGELAILPPSGDVFPAYLIEFVKEMSHSDLLYFENIICKDEFGEEVKHEMLELKVQLCLCDPEDAASD